jgi:cell division transport system permease protein
MVFSKRFIIRTMQLVGATKGFIRKPFLYKSMWHGFIASIISTILIAGLIYVIQNELKGISLMIDYVFAGILFGGLILLGIIINLICTFFSLNKYLNIETEYLY